MAGELRKGETLRQSAIRRVEEEVGVKINESSLDFLCVVHYRLEDDEKEAPLVFFFCAHDWAGEPFNREPERYSDVRWFDLDQLPAHLAPGEDLVFNTYKNYGLNPNAYRERGWGNSSSSRQGI